MWKPFWDEAIAVWPVGIDTDRWRPASAAQKRFDVLLYDKVMWDHERYDASLIEPIREKLRQAGKSFREIRYGAYREAMIFLCEHETQGIAYQQALAAGVPIMAWDRGGYWLDPAYFPDEVKFQPVTSVPYWDARCGRTFAAIEAFDDAWRWFWDELQAGRYDPRAYILENLTLEKCAQDYLHQVQSVSGS
jgi:glycosyltransferase involved in cell wall biosynthesis